MGEPAEAQQPTTELPEIITVEEAAELLRMNVKTIYAAIRNGEAPWAITERSVRVNRTALMAWFDGGSGDAYEDERWIKVAGFPDYEVSSFGRVRSWKPINQFAPAPNAPKLMRPGTDASGYNKVDLRRDGERVTASVHVLVAEAFRGPRPKGLDVAHNDGDPMNNIVSNLRYATRAENEADKKQHRGAS